MNWIDAPLRVKPRSYIPFDFYELILYLYCNWREGGFESGVGGSKKLNINFLFCQVCYTLLGELGKV